MFALGTLILFWLVWACLHDIAHGDEGIIGWTVLPGCVVAFAWLCRQALRHLTGPAKTAWLAGMRSSLSFAVPVPAWVAFYLICQARRGGTRL